MTNGIINTILIRISKTAKAFIAKAPIVLLSVLLLSALSLSGCKDTVNPTIDTVKETADSLTESSVEITTADTKEEMSKDTTTDTSNDVPEESENEITEESTEETQNDTEAIEKASTAQVPAEIAKEDPDTVAVEDADENNTITEAIYLGVVNYGAKEINKNNKDNFDYRFNIKGKEQTFKIDNGTKNAEGNYDYPIQNILKEGYTYSLTVAYGKVISAAEKETKNKSFTPVVQGKPGEKTLSNFLKTAMEPVGTTLFIYGGGWDWQDIGSSVQTRALGVSSDWIKFFNSHDENYTFKEKNGDETLADPKNSYYPYGEYNEYYYAGLDCSGFLGWTIYNTIETENMKEGYVGASTGFAKRLSENGWGTWTQDIKAPDGNNGYEMKPGDIMSISGHVWTSLGTCEDGSVVIVHSSPSDSRTGQPGGGVQISAIGTSTNCQAYVLADNYMSKYYPEWYKRYSIYLCDPNLYFSLTGNDTGRFSWNTAGVGILTDPDGLQNMKPAEVLEYLFK